MNPRVQSAEIVPTSILTLNRAQAVSQAHNLDSRLSSIEGKSREGFIQPGIGCRARPRSTSTAICRRIGSSPRGVYIRDVTFPGELVKVLTQREIANQERTTFEEQQRAQASRVEPEKAVADGEVNIVPEVLVTNGGSLDGLAARVMAAIRQGFTRVPAPVAPSPEVSSGAVDARETPDMMQ